MESKFGYQFSQKAESDLDDIISYIAVELSNPQAATDFLEQLQKTIEEARLFPESGSLVVNDFLVNTDIRKKLIGNYVMYYLLDSVEKMVFIVRIVYGRRNIDEILRQLDV